MNVYKINKAIVKNRSILMGQEKIRKIEYHRGVKLLVVDTVSIRGKITCRVKNLFVNNVFVKTIIDSFDAFGKKSKIEV